MVSVQLEYESVIKLILVTLRGGMKEDDSYFKFFKL